jgi:hypothetical protein
MSKNDLTFLKTWREKYRWPLQEERKASEEKIIYLECLVERNILRKGTLSVKTVLSEIVRWKAARRWEQQMLTRFEKNDEHELERKVLQVCEEMKNNPHNASIFVEILSQLSGVGIPVASAFLRFLDPIEHKYGIIDKNVASFLNDERITNFSLREDGWIMKYPESARRINIKQYQVYHDWLQRKVKEVEGATYEDIYGVQRPFASVDIEMALFAYTTQT